MARAIYFDAFSGVSGDMTVGAMLALGVSFDLLRERLERLGLDGCRVEQSDRLVNGIHAVKFDVVLADDHDHAHTRFAEVRQRLERSALDAAVRERAIAIFTKLAIAEGKIHDKPPEEVLFHEVGAVDSIVDIVGTAICMHELQIEEAYVSTLPLGSGFVQCRHGRMPVPAPATVELLKGFSARYDDGEGELVTPTGAAIVAALARPAIPAGFRIERVGYGAGTRVLEDRPNLLRLVLGETTAPGAVGELVQIEANIDDSNPEIYEHVLEMLFAAGARDVWLQPVQMKKNRPGVVLSVLADGGLRDLLAGIVLRETSSIGVRFRALERIEAPRSEQIVETELGPVAVKISRAPDGTLNVAPEYESCRKIAREKNVALKRVYAAAIAAARTLD